MQHSSAIHRRPHASYAAGLSAGLVCGCLNHPDMGTV
jgi:hypothetical protein